MTPPDPLVPLLPPDLLRAHRCLSSAPRFAETPDKRTLSAEG
jgi:hypothetical protein